MSNSRYSPEFKDEAVKQIIERGYTVAEVSERLGVSAHSLYKWVKEVKPDKADEIADELADELKQAKQEILRLKAELHRTQDERDILKKAAVDSSEQSNSNCKILICMGTFDETYKAYIYPRRKRFSL